MQTLQQVHAATRPDVRVAAFFDVDNTLVPGQAIELRFFRYLWKQGLVGPRDAARSLWYLLRHIPPLSIHPLRERKLYLEGKRPAVIEPLAESFVRSEVCSTISLDALAALDSHRRAGHCLVLITGSLDFLIAPLAGHLKVDKVLAAIPERRGDRYTGQVISPYPYGDGKRHLIESFARATGIDLQHSYAYGDSPGDVDALRSVGHPLVVNPIRGMGRIARREGWRIETWK
ncbi:MAG: HAD-IB family hydrolase [Nitrospirae bacterium]|nr:MAG: HAD-IB family hydrolase [Nitrospirota bacterium]